MTGHARPTRLPTPATPILLHYRDECGNRQFTTPDAAHLVNFEETTPVRDFPRYRGQQHTPGLYWSATDARHLEYESYLECRWMTMLDFDRDVVAIRPQPVHIQCLDSRGSWEHWPDLFVRLRDGRGRIVDVKSPRHVNDPDVQLQAVRTRDVCDLLGLEYTLVSQLDLIPWLNVRWLAGYRRPFHLPDSVAERVIRLAEEPVSIGELVADFDDPGSARVAVLRACWFGQLTFNLGNPLRDTTFVQSTWETS